MTTNIYGKKEEIFGYQTYWRELGNHLSKLELYQKSLKYYDEAVLRNPTNRKTLVARAIARGKTGFHQGAMEDLKNALEEDPYELFTLAKKAHITYLSCDFEEGLIQNLRQLATRGKPEDFYIGRMSCYSAIETCLGEVAGRALRNHFKIIRKLAWKKDWESKKPPEPNSKKKKTPKKLKITKRHYEAPVKVSSEYFDHNSSKTELLSIKNSIHSYNRQVCDVPPYHGSVHFSPLQKYTSNLNKYMASKYLDIIYHEKYFLKDIQSEPGLVSPNHKGYKRMKEIARDCFSNICHQQEVLRARRPFYYIKYQEASLSASLRARQEEDLHLQQRHLEREAEKILLKLRNAAERKNLSEILEMAEKLKLYCDSKTKRLLPARDEYLKEVFQKMRRGFYELNRLNSQLNRWDQNKRIQVALGQQVSRTPSQDSVISHYETFHADYKQYIKVYTRRLKKAEMEDEICCCYHELARFHMELKLFEQARANARKCINTGKDRGNLEWEVNGLMLLSRIHMREQNRNDAIADVKEALGIAENLMDQQLIHYLERCLEVIEDSEFHEMSLEKEIEKREKRIIELIANQKLREEFIHLFGLMSSMPQNRRMSVMPGVRFNIEEGKSGKGKAQSILKSSARISTHSMMSRRSSKSGKSTPSTGESLMQLIQFHM
nr:tetratricopeptide repeat protein 25-like [Leptinotarsa decemlineata]